MDLSLEAYRLILNNLTGRSDICTLCQTSRRFQQVAERALYNTLYFQNPTTTILLCNTIISQPRVATLVDALSVFAPEDEDSDGEERPILDDYWQLVSHALQFTIRLRHLNAYLNSQDKSWILQGCTFQLQSFHCDLKWDPELVSFLNHQHDLSDLCIVDFNVSNTTTSTDTPTNVSTPSLTIYNLLGLSTLECTFTEAATALVPGRPITHLKTCFSRSETDEKRTELVFLFSMLQLSTQPIHSLDIADSSYNDSFSMELLTSVVTMLPHIDELRYLGILVLPINGRERLRFYGLLRRLSRLRCIEVEVSEWEPAPTSRAALRALATELRLYCPSVTCVIFIHDFDRMVITVTNGLCELDNPANADGFWREF